MLYTEEALTFPLTGYMKSGVSFVGSTMLTNASFCVISNYVMRFPFLGIGTQHNEVSCAHQLLN